MVRIKSQPNNKEDWKGLSIFAMTMAMSLNYVILMTVLQECIDNWFYNIQVDILSGEKLDGAIEYLILFFVPMLIINYWFIFRNKKYEYLIEKYKYYNGKRFMIFFFGTLSAFLLLVFFAM